MKFAVLTILAIAGVFGLFKLYAVSRTKSDVHTAVSKDKSPILKECIKKLNSEEKLCLGDYPGKKILIVNVASHCGYTYQYKDLQTLYDTNKDKLIIIGFPCNQFGGQESDPEEEIATFCSSKLSVTFPITTKVSVKGKEQHPIFKWLTNKSENGVGDYTVTWNFNKFLLDENGQLIGYFSSKVNPMDSSITNLLK